MLASLCLIRCFMSFMTEVKHLGGNAYGFNMMRLEVNLRKLRSVSASSTRLYWLLRSTCVICLRQYWILDTVCSPYLSGNHNEIHALMDIMKWHHLNNLFIV